MIGTISRFGIYFFEFCNNICKREGDEVKRHLIRHSKYTTGGMILLSVVKTEAKYF